MDIKRMFIIILVLAMQCRWNGEIAAQITINDFLATEQIQLLNESYVFEKNKDYDNAVRLNNQLCIEWPDKFACAYARHCIAKMYFKSGRTQEANEMLDKEIKQSDQWIMEHGDSYYSALCLIVNALNYYDKSRYDDSLSEEAKNKLWEKSMQQLETILEYELTEFNGTEDEFYLVANFALQRVAGYLTLVKGELGRAEELLSRIPKGKKYGAGLVAAELIHKHTKDSNWAKVAELINQYGGQDMGRGRVINASVDGYFYNQAMLANQDGNISLALDMLKSIQEPSEKTKEFMTVLELEIKGEEETERGIYLDDIDETLYREFTKAFKLHNEAEKLLSEGEYDSAREKAEAAQLIFLDIKSKSPELEYDAQYYYDACEKIKTTKADHKLNKDEVRRREISDRAGADVKVSKKESEVVIPEEESKKISEEFQKASLFIEEAHRYLAADEFLFAQGKAKDAHNILLDIHRRYPGWNYEAVERSREECREIFYSKTQQKKAGIGEADQAITPAGGEEGISATGMDEIVIPTEQYREAYLLIREGRKAIYEENPEKARSNIKSAREILLDIQDKSPDWNPAAVKARLEECANLLNTPIRPR